jgi:beta-phosphoglucomutase
MRLDLNRFEAVIFDMDGTMIENTKFHDRAWQEFIKRHNINIDLPEFYLKSSGKKNDAIFEILFGRKVEGDEYKRLDEEKESIYRELYKPNFKEVAGLKTFLNRLSKMGLKTGVATTASLKNRVFVLENLELQDFFAVVVGAEHVREGKPHPEIYLLAAEKLGVNPKKCLAFEDTRSGIKSAKSAGMTVVGVLTTHTKEELNEADHFIKDFTEIKI